MPADHAAVEAALAAAPTRILYLETISNPTIAVADLPALAALGHRHGAAVIVDNTFASPALCRPLEHGADLVVESATKYLSGHSDVLAGVVVGSRARIAAIRDLHVETGGTLAPFSAFLVLRGIPTLALRMERHAATAARLAAFLETAEGVARVLYPMLPSHPHHAVATRLLASGGGMLALDLAGGAVAARAFVDALRIPERTASLGSIHTIVVHPPSTTHRQLSAAELAEAGIAPGLVRVSVGLEDADDLLADMAQALEAARAARDGPARGGPRRTAGPRRARPRAWMTLLARPGRAVYRLLTSVRFAVVQIIAIALVGVVGIIVPQLPGAAFRSPADFAEQLAILRARVEPSLGAPVTDLFEALGLFRVFSAWWFTAMLALLAVSIVVCTLDRTPGLWRSARDVRVVQPDGFFDPDLPDRAVIARRAPRRGRARGAAALGVPGARGGGARRRPLPVRRPQPEREAVHPAHPRRAGRVHPRRGDHEPLRLRDRDPAARGPGAAGREHRLEPAWSPSRAWPSRRPATPTGASPTSRPTSRSTATGRRSPAR